ncbi:MAG: helix-turn-helix domain-containing protein [Oscillospiraceae bacterium]|nr:helix-turn-helix domain-containing protein [Oscillospiraceae bacterium]
MKEKGLIDSRENKPTRLSAELINFRKYNKPKQETPKEWDELPLYIKTRDIVKITGISSPTITKLITDGELKASKIAGKWFIFKDDFKEFMVSKQYIAGVNAS